MQYIKYLHPRTMHSYVSGILYISWDKQFLKLFAWQITSTGKKSSQIGEIHRESSIPLDTHHKGSTYLFNLLTFGQIVQLDTRRWNIFSHSIKASLIRAHRTYWSCPGGQQANPMVFRLEPKSYGNPRPPPSYTHILQQKNPIAVLISIHKYIKYV